MSTTATTSNRQEILDAVEDRLCAIQKTGGYQTDAGKAVFRGETPTLGPDDPDVAVAMVILDDEPRYQGEQIVLRLPIELQALAKANLEHPSRAVEAVLADIKKAIEQPDRTLGGTVRRQIERGTTRTLERQDGSETVGVSVTYIAPYVEVWGSP